MTLCIYIYINWDQSLLAQKQWVVVRKTTARRNLTPINSKEILPHKKITNSFPQKLRNGSKNVQTIYFNLFNQTALYLVHIFISVICSYIYINLKEYKNWDWRDK